MAPLPGAALVLPALHLEQRPENAALHRSLSRAGGRRGALRRGQVGVRPGGELHEAVGGGQVAPLQADEGQVLVGQGVVQVEGGPGGAPVLGPLLQSLQWRTSKLVEHVEVTSAVVQPG